MVDSHSRRKFLNSVVAAAVATSTTSSYLHAATEGGRTVSVALDDGSHLELTRGGTGFNAVHCVGGRRLSDVTGTFHDTSGGHVVLNQGCVVEADIVSRTLLAQDNRHTKFTNFSLTDEKK